jgi:hypothetical protein
MELTTAMLADAAQVANGKLYILGGQWDRLLVQSFPAQHPTLTVVLVLRVEYSEALDEHRMEIVLQLDGQRLDAGAVASFMVGHAPGQRRGSPSFIPLALPFNNLRFETAGRYEWTVAVDDQPLGSVPIDVVTGRATGMHAQ